MYRQVETDKAAPWGYKRSAPNAEFNMVEPIATLADEDGGRIQIILDDQCYVVLLKNGETGVYDTMTWLNDAVIALLKTLTLPR